MSVNSVLSQFFESIEAAGGTGTCRIMYSCHPAEDKGKECFSNLRFHVEITVPFTHAGQELLAKGEGKHSVGTTFLVNSRSDITYPLQQGRIVAFKRAVRSLAENVQQEMKTARPTTSNTRCKRKAVAVLKRIEAAEFAH